MACQTKRPPSGVSWLVVDSGPDFKLTMFFVNTVAGLAEKAGHHPDIAVTYNRVTLTLSTHDAGGLTRKDFDLAGQIEAML